jgi:hypothetical protein
MPEVARKLIDSFDKDDLSLSEVSSLIARDQALAAKVLRLANSARYSPSRTVSSLNDASASLGLRTLRDLTLSACMTGAFPAFPGFDRMAFWRSTLVVATYAQVLAPALDVDPDTAYLGGLMLRTGQILMAIVDGPGMAEVARHAVEIDSQIGFESAIDPLAVRPFCRLGATLRLASVVADCTLQKVKVADGLRATHPELVQKVNLDLDWLVAHLPDPRLAMAGADALMH